MIDSDSASKFSFAFFLAILFHLLVIALFILGLYRDSENGAKTPLEAMQASILETSPLTQVDESEFAESSESPKKLSRLARKRVAHEKKQALILEQAEKKKLVAAAAQELLNHAIETAAENQNQQKAIAALAEQNRSQVLEVHRLKQVIEQRVKALERQKSLPQNQEQKSKLRQKPVSDSQELLREQLETIVGEKIGNLWKQPAKTEGLNCIIQVHLDTQGRIKNLFMEQTSGNKIFDDSAKKAIYQANDFQIQGIKTLPPEIVLEGFSINFGEE